MVRQAKESAKLSEGLEFPDGQIVLLTHLTEGLRPWSLLAPTL